jgi:hypothetical protein
VIRPLSFKNKLQDRLRESVDSMDSDLRSFDGLKYDQIQAITFKNTQLNKTNDESSKSCPDLMNMFSNNNIFDDMHKKSSMSPTRRSKFNKGATLFENFDTSSNSSQSSTRINQGSTGENDEESYKSKSKSTKRVYFS